MTGPKALGVAGIVPESSLLRRWRQWFAPDVQPFVVDDRLRDSLGAGHLTDLPMELQDTFMIYDPQSHTDLVGLSHAAFASLAPPTRAALTRYQVSAGRRLVPTLKSVPATWRRRLKADGDGHRFVWWPDTLRQTGDEPLLRFVADDLLPSRHEQVSRQTWRRAASVLPGARELAGTFARSSGPNCFGTVMAAAGVANTADQWMLREPFEEWLCTHTRQGGADHLVGTVLVWRDVRGAAQHAAVVVGDGWAMHKPSQGWMTPRKVLAVEGLKRRARRTGLRISRRLINAG